MTALFIRGLVRCLGVLPLPVNQWLGYLIGQVAYGTRSKSRQIALVNIKICYPNMDPDEQKKLARLSLIETGKSLTEAAWIWTNSLERIQSRITYADGHELYQEYVEQPEGLLIATPHWGAWELCSLPLSQDRKFTYLYREPRLRALDEPLIRWRAHLGGHPATLDTVGIRKALRVLKSGETLGILPDQEPDRNNGVFAPFFGTEANTMTLFHKFASRPKVNTLVCLVERLPRAKGWKVRFIKPDAAINASDKLQAAIAVNRTVEHCIAINPAQYNWSYKRFRYLPDGGKRNYALK
ncbi:MAG: lysophospholipid acyltransferase family protein [Gammaproteobacteria bacterium]|nr:lysophospholipid acyltransferase family protein [Gammaproteobacteria bacterium]